MLSTEKSNSFPINSIKERVEEKPLNQGETATENVSATIPTTAAESIEKSPLKAMKNLNLGVNITTEESDKNVKQRNGKAVNQGEFEAERHYYPRVLNAHIHPLVSSFFNLGNKRILARYTHLNPQVNSDTLKSLLSYAPKYFLWAGSDLFNVTTASGHRQMIVVETNSCPSGQKSMPLLDESQEDFGGYAKVIEHSAKELISKIDPAMGGLAVVFDKNPMEATGYAEVLADVMKEKVWIAEYYKDDKNPPVKWVDGILYIRDASQGLSDTLFNAHC